MVAKQNKNDELLEEPQPPEAKLPEAETTAEPDTVEQAEEVDGLQQEIEVLQMRVQEHLDKAIRAQAELDNMRKRTLRDIENAHKYALEKFANDLLPVIDSMELGINATDSTDSTEQQQTLKEGMDLTLKMFRDVLEKYGVTEVKSEGEKFDPEKHEAVSMQELEGVGSGVIITVLQKGYMLNGRLIRPAMVVVAK